MTRKLALPALDPAEVPVRRGSSYPEPFKAPCADRAKQRLGDAVGLTDFGVNLVRLPPGSASAQRHWHSHEDEFVYVLSGELTLVTDAGDQRLAAGEAAGFPAGAADGHHLVNRGSAEASYLEVGSRKAEDAVSYPDVDLHLPGKGGEGFTNKKGEAYRS
jgi:uncharacterized cupin superfamily protein